MEYVWVWLLGVVLIGLYTIGGIICVKLMCDETDTNQLLIFMFWPIFPFAFLLLAAAVIFGPFVIGMAIMDIL